MRLSRLVPNPSAKGDDALAGAAPLDQAAAPTSARKNLLERVLSLATEIRPGEGAGVILLATAFVLLLGAYYLAKTVRESLILTEGGAEIKAYSSAAQAVLLLGVVPLYGWITTRLNRNQVMGWTTFFFASNLVLFYLVGQMGYRVGVSYYIWVGIFNVFSVTQLWSLASDLFSECDGKRLFPLLGAGASIGAVGGAWAAGKLIKPLGPYNIMLVAASIICLSGLASRVAGHFITKHTGVAEKVKDSETLNKDGAFKLIFSDRYLLLIALLTIVLNIVSLSGDFLFGKLLVERTDQIVGSGAALLQARKAYVGAFYAQYYELTNLFSFLIQTFLVSQIFKRIGVRGSLFVLPTVSFTMFLSIMWFPVLAVVRTFKIAENSFNYSLQNTVQHALFLPTTREAKYKAQSAVNTFGMRLGDVLQAGIIFLGTSVHLSIRSFGLVSLSMTALWLFLASLLYREHKRRLVHLPEAH
jgi:ATP:ADP antiporter, AAA family